MKAARIYMKDLYAGLLIEDENGYTFQYDSEYLTSPLSHTISLILPLSPKPYVDKVLFPFFDGLIPEGCLLTIAEENWKINQHDRMSLLLACFRDCIGAVSVREVRVVNEEGIEL